MIRNLILIKSAKSLKLQDAKKHLTDTACALLWLETFASIHILGKITLSVILSILSFIKAEGNICRYYLSSYRDEEDIEPPFAVVGSNVTIEREEGKSVRGREYPWGVVDIENKVTQNRTLKHI